MQYKKYNLSQNISLHDAAKESGLHQDYLRFLCRTGKLEGEKNGRNWTTTLSAVFSYQESQKQKKDLLYAQQKIISLESNSEPVLLKSETSKAFDKDIPVSLKRYTKSQIILSWIAPLAMAFVFICLYVSSGIIFRSSLNPGQKIPIITLMPQERNDEIPVFEQIAPEMISQKGEVLGSNIVASDISSKEQKNFDPVQPISADDYYIRRLIDAQINQLIANGIICVSGFIDTLPCSSAQGIGNGSSAPVTQYPNLPAGFVAQQPSTQNYSYGTIFSATQLSAESFSGGSFSGSSLVLTGAATVGGFKFGSGAGDGKVLTSDASGNASWQTPGGASGTLDGGGVAGYLSYWSASTTLNSSSLFETSTRIGIGTTTPVQKLVVAGDFRATGALYDSSNSAGTSGMVLQTTGTGYTWVATSTLGISGGALSGGTNGYVARWTSSSNLSTGRIIDNGTVAGINATSSSYSFNIQGSSGVNPLNIASSTGISLVTVTQTGNVGIGTSNPQVTLDVAGDIVALHSVGIYGTGAGAAQLYLQDDINGYGGIDIYSFQNNGSSPQSYFNLIGSRGTSTNPSGLVTDDVLGSFNFYGGGSTGSILLGTSISSVAEANFATTTAPASLLFSTGFDERMRITSSGNVGIGTTTPGRTLTVVGDARFTGSLYDSSNSAGTSGQVLQTTGTGYTWVATSTLGISGGALSGGTNGYVARWTSSSNLSTGRIIDNGTVAGFNATSSVYSFNIQGNGGVHPLNIASSTGTSLAVFTQTGNVGINTTNPAQKLDIRGGNFIINTNGTAADNVLIGDPPGSGYPGIWLGSSAASPSYSNYSFLSDGTGGNLFNSASGQLSRFRINNVAVMTVGGNGVNIGGPDTGSVADAPGYPFQVHTATSDFLITSAGNVGVGTTTPTGSLHVQGLAAVNPFVISSSSGATLFTVLPTGNIGVNTTTPLGQLSIISSTSTKPVAVFTTTAAPTVDIAQFNVNGTNMAGFNNTGGLYLNNNSSVSGALITVNNVQTWNGGTLLTWGTGPRLTIYDDGQGYGAVTLQAAETNFVIRGAANRTTGIGVIIPASAAGVTPLAVRAAASQTADIMQWQNSAGTVLAALASNGALTVGSTTKPATLYVVGIASSTLPALVVASSSSASLFAVAPTGNVGIGTTTPLANLHVNNPTGLTTVTYQTPAGNAIIQDYVIGSSFDTNSYRVDVNYGSAGWYRINYGSSLTNQFLIDGPNSRASFTGRLGIGTSTPQAKLAVYPGDDTTTVGMQIVRNVGADALQNVSDTDYNLIQLGIDEVGYLYGNSTIGTNQQGGDLNLSGGFGTGNKVGGGIAFWSTASSTSGSARNNPANQLMYIAQSGRVGINSSTPIATLSIQGLSNTPVLAITSSSGASLLRVTQQGNTGVGTATPQTRLAVVGTGASNDIFDLATSSGASYLRVTATGNVGIGSSTPSQKLTVHGNLNFNTGGLIDSQTTVNSGQNDLTVTSNDVLVMKATDQFHFYTNGALMASFKSNGNVAIGNQTPNYQLHVNTDSAGKPNGGSWSDSSDARLKKNIEPLTGALDKITKLQGVSFDWIHPENHGNITNSGGFIAQEIEKVFPQFVNMTPCAGTDCNLTNGEPARSLSLPFSFDAYLIEGIKELNRNIETGISQLQQKLLNHSHVYYASEQIFIPGSIVAYDTASNAVFVATKSYTPNLLGVVSGTTSAINSYAIAVSGNQPVKVTNENGNIFAGDYLTTSEKYPGFAMKATRSGMVLGQAVTSFTASSTDTSGVLTANIHPHFAVINNHFVLEGKMQEAGGGVTSTATSYLVNQEGGGNILQLQTKGIDRFLVANDGSVLINASSPSTTNVLSVKVLAQDVFTINAVGHITVGGDTSGSAMIAAGHNQVTVTFGQSYTTTPKVMVTPDDFVGFRVADKTIHGFTIQLEDLAQKDVSFDWLALNQATSTTQTNSTLNQLVVAEVQQRFQVHDFSSMKDTTQTIGPILPPVGPAPEQEEVKLEAKAPPTLTPPSTKSQPVLTDQPLKEF